MYCKLFRRFFFENQNEFSWTSTTTHEWYTHPKPFFRDFEVKTTTTAATYLTSEDQPTKRCVTMNGRRTDYEHSDSRQRRKPPLLSTLKLFTVYLRFQPQPRLRVNRDRRRMGWGVPCRSCRVRGETERKMRRKRSQRWSHQVHRPTPNPCQYFVDQCKFILRFATPLQ